MSISNRVLRYAALLPVLAIAGPAMAADLGGARRPAVTPEPFEYREPANFERWTGLYFGLTYGYGTGWTDVTGDSGAFDISTTGGIGTAFAGYNWRAGNAIYGLEADIGAGNLAGSENGVETDLNALGSVRGRLGYLVTPDFLLYGTAGLAWANLDVSTNGDTQSNTFIGYEVGGGTELKFTDPWALRLEYVYTDLSSETLDNNGVSNAFDPAFHTIRAGLSYKF